MIPSVVQQVEDGAFPLQTFIMKPHGGGILPDDK